MKITLAIHNNMALYQAIFEANNIALKVNSDIYFSEEESPPLYSNLVTLTKNWRVDEQFKRIEQNFLKGWSEWSIKDSFQCLDLSAYGFSRLFDAHWFYLSASEFLPFATQLEFEFKIVKNKADLQQWIFDWGEGLELGRKIFNEKLIADPIKLNL